MLMHGGMGFDHTYFRPWRGTAALLIIELGCWSEIV